VSNPDKMTAAEVWEVADGYKRERDAAVLKLPRWRNVDDELPPPPKGRVLSYIVACTTPAGERYATRSSWSPGYGNGWTTAHDPVTHWMPFPELPQ
jgi:hypothetical protein